MNLTWRYYDISNLPPQITKIIYVLETITEVLCHSPGEQCGGSDWYSCKQASSTNINVLVWCVCLLQVTNFPLDRAKLLEVELGNKFGYFWIVCQMKAKMLVAHTEPILVDNAYYDWRVRSVRNITINIGCSCVYRQVHTNTARTPEILQPYWPQCNWENTKRMFRGV